MLALEELLVETDEDLPIVATVIIGFDDNGCLVLEHKIMDYDVPEESRTKYAVVEKQEAYVLAKKVKVSLMQLPAYVFKKYAVQPFCQAVPSEARTLFKAILDFFAFYGVKYRLKDAL